MPEQGATRLDTVIKGLVDRLLDATSDRDRDLGENPMQHATGAPASAQQIAALERHWGHPLPPIFRSMLVSYNGLNRLWFDVRMLSIEDIIDGSEEMRRFEAMFPELWRSIFACGTASSDALAFDLSRIQPDGDIEVVHLGGNGPGRRWRSIGFLLNELETSGWLGLRAGGDTIYYLWTNLWTFWPGTCSHQSRSFVSGRDERLHPLPKALFAAAARRGGEPLLRDDDLAQVDHRFREATEILAKPKRGLAIVLTDGDVERTAEHYYVYYEPCANLVVALDPVERRVAVHGDCWLLEAQTHAVTSFLARADQLMTEQRVTDALLSAIDGACEALTRTE